jgi:glycosyltransferase involved in cell wall biosynthesis
MKIVYIANMRMPTERAHGLQIMRMCEAFARLGAQVTLLYPFRFQSNPKLRGQDIFEFFGIQRPFEIRRVPHLDLLPLEAYFGRALLRPFYIFTNSLFSLMAARQANRLKADIYYTREWMVAWWLVRRGCPTVLEIHQTEGFAFSPRAQQIITKLSYASELQLIVVISNGLKLDLIKAGVPERKILVLPDAVNMHAYEKPLAKSEARTQIGLPQNVALIVYTGSFLRGRGVHILADSSRYLLYEALIVLVGGNPQEQHELEQYIRSHKIERVVIWGHLSPKLIPIFQQSADVLALPQLPIDAQHVKHSSPLKLFEYMASRRPIVASDLPSLREVLEHERNALLVPPGDPKALAQAIQRLLDDPELGQRLANAAFERVKEWTWERRAQKILEALKERGCVNI